MLIGYARVSTEEQSLGLQLTALRQAGCLHIFEDRGVSGAKVRRPGLAAALAALTANDTLVVWRLDRLGRSLSHLIQIIQRLEKDGVNFRSLTENMDTGSSGGRLVFHIMGAMAEFERALISERTRAGMRAARQAGRTIGRPPAIDGKRQEEVIQAVTTGEAKEVVARRYQISRRTVDRLLATSR